MSLPTVRHWRKTEIQPIMIAVRLTGDSSRYPVLMNNLQAIDAVSEAMGHGITADENILSVIGSVREEIGFAANLTESIWIDLVHKIGAARKRYLRSDDNRIMANDYGQLSTMAVSADRMLELAGDSWRESIFHLYFHPGLIGGSTEDSSGEEEREDFEDNRDEDEYEDDDYESDEDHDVVMLGHAVSELDLEEETGDIEMAEY